MNLTGLLKQATPLPWVVNKRDKGWVDGWVDSSTGAEIASFNQGRAPAVETNANTALAVHAVNMLPKLVEALSKMMRLHYDEGKPSLEGLDAITEAEAVLTEANNPNQ